MPPGPVVRLVYAQVARHLDLDEDDGHVVADNEKHGRSAEEVERVLRLEDEIWGGA